MAWKRGVQNNQAGVIRKGHIKEFLEPSSKCIGVSGKLRVLELEQSSLFDGLGLDLQAYVCTPENGLPVEFREHLRGNNLLLHTHEHPRVILSATVSPLVPPNAILLNDIQRLNNKVCAGENAEFTVYQMETFAYDAREGVIGNTILRTTSVPPLTEVTFSIRPQLSCAISNTLNTPAVTSQIRKILFGRFISRDELFRIRHSHDGTDTLFIVRVIELQADDDDDCVMPDIYRGRLDANTVRCVAVILQFIHMIFRILFWRAKTLPL